MKSSTGVSVLILLVVASTTAYSVNKQHLNTPPESRIIGGEVSSPGQFPYQAALRINVTDRPGFSTCGGTLIAVDYTMTAAHCVLITGASHIEVHLGAYDIYNLEEEGRISVIVPKENFIPHKGYDSRSLVNDIALLKFNEKVTLTDKIQILPLPTRSDANINFEGKIVVSSGWGRYSDDEQVISPVMKYMNVVVESQRICQHFYANYEVVTASNICTYTGLRDGVCNGDSGGPLRYTDENGRQIVIGVTSFVSDIGCVVSGWPSVFTRVTSFLDWIEENSNIVIKP